MLGLQPKRFLNFFLIFCTILNVLIEKIAKLDLNTLQAESESNLIIPNCLKCI